MALGDTYLQSEFEAGINNRANLDDKGIIDAWSFYDFKDHFRQADHIVNGAITPSWVPIYCRRRLRAYELLDSMYKLSGRRWVNAPEPDKKDRREYGDPFLIVEAVIASVLGDDPKIQVKGVLPDEKVEGTGLADECQVILEEWADSENFFLEKRNNERNTVKLGDGIVVLGWDKKKKRPRFRIYDPGSYFPVESATSDEAYPEKVHIAYEYEDEDPEDKGRKTRYVRRITWEMREVPAYSVPWAEDKATESCFYSDMRWELGEVKSLGDVDDFSLDNADITADSEDLGLDFLPVVHYPNMAPQDLWGTSVLAPIVQLLDDIVATDTDLQNASQLTGSPVLALGGSSAPKDDEGNVKNYGPGTVYETGEGKLDYLDTSHSLDALMKLQKEMRDTMSVNARTPSTLLGRVDPGKVQAGVILTLSFAPHTTMIREMREIRDAKDALVLKFVLRMYMKDGKITNSKKLPRATVTPGSFLPADKMEIGTILGVLVPAKVISMETGIQMCIQAGYPIEDIKQEVLRIQKRDFAGATDLVTATNDTEAGREYLQLGAAPPATTEAERLKLEQEQQQATIDKTKNPPPPPPAPVPVPKPTPQPAPKP